MKKIMFNDFFGLTEDVLSGRKTQTRLKREIAEDKAMMKRLNCSYPTMRRIHLWDAINQSVKLKEQEFHQLKRKKR